MNHGPGRHETPGLGHNKQRKEDGLSRITPV
jgi:hypothetical protein